MSLIFEHCDDNGNNENFISFPRRPEVCMQCLLLGPSSSLALHTVKNQVQGRQFFEDNTFSNSSICGGRRTGKAIISRNA